MDIVSSTASVIAIIQLCESIKKVLAFGRAVQDAPATVDKLFQDLELLLLVVLQARNIHHCLAFDEVSERAIQNCERKTSALLTKLSKAQSTFKTGNLRHRKWNALKITLKADEIASLRVSIEEAKSILQIVQNKSILDCLISVDQKQKDTLLQIELINQLIQEVSRKETTIVKASMQIYSIQQPDVYGEVQYDPVSGSDETAVDTSPRSKADSFGNVGHLHDEDTRPNTSFHSTLLQKRELKKSWKASYRTPFFELHNESRTYDMLSKMDSDSWAAEDKESRCIILPSIGSKFLGLRWGVLISAKSTMGWKYTIQHFRLVPDDSLIFEFCKTGNVAGLQALFKRGSASPWDRDADGRTPLWVAAQALQPEIAKVLLQQGADPSECDWKYNAQPIYGVAKSNTTPIEPKLTMIRILQSHQQQTVDTTTSTQMMGRFILDYRLSKNISMPWIERQKAVTKLLHALLSDLHPEHHAVAELLFVAVRYYHEGPALQWILKNMKGDIETPDGRNSVLYEAMGVRLLERDWKSMRMIVQRTGNLHSPVQIGHWTEEKETPTAQAMHNMQTFLLWRSMLVSLDLDINQFIKGELAVKDGLAAKGWNERSLALLFRSDGRVEDGIEQHSGKTHFCFPVCERCGADSLIAGQRLHMDLAWRRRLRSVRLGKFDFTKDLEKINLQQETTCIAPCNSSTRKKVSSLDEKLPYRIVCLRGCSDGVAAAFTFENDGEAGENPILPAFPLGVEKDEYCSTTEALRDIKEPGNDCPTRSMPGAFVD